nr:MAG TPA: hypothetical protein [Caudoviricetes sp.]
MLQPQHRAKSAPRDPTGQARGGLVNTIGGIIVCKEAPTPASTISQ